MSSKFQFSDIERVVEEILIGYIKC